MIADLRTHVITASEFTDWSGQSEHQGIFYELHHGEVIEMSPSGIYSSAIAMRIAMYLSQFVESHQLGYVTGEQGGYQLSDYDVFAPDVAFISKERLQEMPTKGFALAAPDLAIEIMSHTDSKRALRRKAERYLELGTRMVWLVFPIEQHVEVYLPDEDVQMLTLEAYLDGAAVLAGFSLPVASIFPRQIPV